MGFGAKEGCCTSYYRAKLPRRRKTPQCYEAGSGLPHFPDTVENYYRRIYFEVLDSAVSTIKDRFDQPNYEIYKQVENLLKTVRGEDASNELATVATSLVISIKITYQHS